MFATGYFPKGYFAGGYFPPPVAGVTPPVVNRRGCVHGMDAALWSVRCADGAVTNVTGADVALWSVKAKDESC